MHGRFSGFGQPVNWIAADILRIKDGVLGGASGLNYATDYRNADGIVVPTKRRVYTPDANKQKTPDPVLVAIDIRDIAFSAVWDASDSTVRRHQEGIELRRNEEWRK